VAAAAAAAVGAAGGKAGGRGRAGAWVHAAPARAAPLTPALAAAIAASAVRYFDLSHAASASYQLDFAAALALKGNTAPYIMYALTRLAAIRRSTARALAAHRSGAADGAGGGDAAGAVAVPGVDDEDAPAPTWGELLEAVGRLAATGEDAVIAAPQERALALAVLRLPEALAGVDAALSAHGVAEHMHSTANAFHSFYEACRVLQLPAPHGGAGAAGEGGGGGVGATGEEGGAAAAAAALVATSRMRLQLCAATDRALRLGCHVLGVSVLERM
jgi:arginyl-tRNA synthetase